MRRRAFVKDGALSLVTIGLAPALFRRVAFAAPTARGTRGKVLVVLFQRGAADGLNVLVPHGDASYYALRGGLAVPRPSLAEGTAKELDGFFGLHPAMAPLLPFWRDGSLAAVHAVGSPSGTRSHFDAQDYLESGTPDVKSTASGWLNRVLATRGTCEACAPGTAAASPFRGVSLTPQTPRILEGPSPTVAMTSLGDFGLRASGTAAERLEALYRTGSADLVHAQAQESFEAVRMLRAADPQRYRPSDGVTYPAGVFGQRLLQIAQLIKADVGLEVAFTDIGGWDTHVNQGAATGQLANRLREFSAGMAAFARDLGDRMEDVLVLTLSEFGRTVRPNGTGGTDHGHAGAMFALGGGVRGGQVLGRWPGLAPEQLYEGRDLALTTDVRAVLAEVVTGHLGRPAETLGAVFPGFTPPSAPAGILRVAR
ncbi:MAG: DUF1501 domain-containing protein [Gemmatimonadaceae bacterium]|nr:DUF1501 domain-containing protein [Gemmatimonadaceae bacterium]